MVTCSVKNMIETKKADTVVLFCFLFFFFKMREKRRRFHDLLT